jgi:hypothetical protein
LRNSDKERSNSVGSKVPGVRGLSYGPPDNPVSGYANYETIDDDLRLNADLSSVRDGDGTGGAFWYDDDLFSATSFDGVPDDDLLRGGMGMGKGKQGMGSGELYLFLNAILARCQTHHSLLTTYIRLAL